MQLRSSVANSCAAYPTSLTTVYALTNILFVGFRKEKRSITQMKEKKGNGEDTKAFLLYPTIFRNTKGHKDSLLCVPHRSIMWVYTDSM